jgi:hypothetical protein
MTIYDYLRKLGEANVQGLVVPVFRFPSTQKILWRCRTS